MDSGATGSRVREARKRAGLTHEELAARSGVSLSLIAKLERGEYGGMRLETVRKLAVVLQVTTSSLMSEPDAAEPERGNIEDWAPLRSALDRTLARDSDDEPTIGGVRDAFNDAVDAVLASRYAELRALLPTLVRDTDDLVATSAPSAVARARQIRSDVRHLAAYMLGQTWQFDAANQATELAISDADDDLTALAALDCKCWLLLRQGRLAESRELATRWAGAAEPRQISKATADELAGWGRLLVWVSSTSVRDNRPGDAKEALRLARMAAAGIDVDLIPHYNPWEVFGPATVAMVRAENAMIEGHPDLTLDAGSRITGQGLVLTIACVTDSEDRNHQARPGERHAGQIHAR
jgi:transcriptional regulator with XRE-family HTH domain